MPTAKPPDLFSWLSSFPHLKSYHQNQKTFPDLMLTYSPRGESWAGTIGGDFSVRKEDYKGFSLQTRALPGICSVRLLSYTSLSFGEDPLTGRVLTNYALSWFNDLLSGPYASLVWIGYDKDYFKFIQNKPYPYNYGNNILFKTLLEEMRLEGGFLGGHTSPSIPYKMCFYVRDKNHLFKLLKETNESGPDIRGESIQPQPTKNPQAA